MRGGWTNFWNGMLKLCSGNSEEARRCVRKLQQAKQQLSAHAKFRNREKTKGQGL